MGPDGLLHELPGNKQDLIHFFDGHGKGGVNFFEWFTRLAFHVLVLVFVLSCPVLCCSLVLSRLVLSCRVLCCLVVGSLVMSHFTVYGQR
jgi:hypothetical protein